MAEKDSAFLRCSGSAWPTRAAGHTSPTSHRPLAGGWPCASFQAAVVGTHSLPQLVFLLHLLTACGFFQGGTFFPPHLQTVRKKEGSWPCAHLQSVAWPPGSNPCKWTPPHAATVSLYPCSPHAGPGWHPAGCWEDAESRHRGTRCCCRACGQLLSRPRPRDCLVESWQHRDACSKGLGPPLLAFDGGGPCGWAQLALSPPEGACCAATHPDPGYGRLRSG